MSGFLDNPLIKNMVKKKLPEIIDNLDGTEESLVKFIKAQELQEGETHCSIFTDIDKNGKVFLCVGAFHKKKMVRLIDANPAKEFLKTMLQNALK